MAPTPTPAAEAALRWSCGVAVANIVTSYGAGETGVVPFNSALLPLDAEAAAAAAAAAFKYEE